MTRIAHHALLKFDAAALLLDLRSGGLFQLNESATFVWEHWLGEMTTGEIASALAQTYRLPLETAGEHVAAALASKAIAAPPPTEFVYERWANRYLFSRGAESILTVDDRGGAIALAESSPIAVDDLRNVLLAISPKLLALRGHCVLHASAVLLGSEVLAFCGESGAGKTTTARALAQAGASLVCEDKLVIQRRGDCVEAVTGIEAMLLRWSQAAAETLLTGTAAPCPDLDHSDGRQPLALREIGFIDATRRKGGEIAAVPLTPLAGAAGVFRNTFYGSDVSGDWARQLHLAGEIAHRVATYELTMPAGTERLPAAAANLARRGSLRSR